MNFLKESFFIFFLIPILIGSSYSFSTAQTTERPFISVWKTDNPGKSGNNQITFPGVGTRYTIEWEEVGNASNTGTISGIDSFTITFPKSGTYRLKASGGLTRFYFELGYSQDFNDRLKLLSVDQWGDIKWSSMESMFLNAGNFELNATDIPDLSQVTSLVAMFSGAAKFNSPIGSWNVSNVRNISSIFQDASSFNQDLSRWDVSKIVYFNYALLRTTSFNQNLESWNLESANSVIEFLNYSGMSPTNYGATLAAWANNPKTPKNLTLGAAGLVYEDPTARNKLISEFGWKIIGDSRLNPPESGYFITTWKTDNPGGTTSNQIKFPGTGNNYKIQWEEVGNSANNGSVLGSGEQILNLPKPGIYRLKVSGGIYRFHFDWDEPQKPNDRLKLLSVDQWGEVVWATMYRAFLHAENFELKATDAPDLTLVRELSEAFRGAKKFNSPIGHWKTSTVINYGSTFQDAILFNQDISGWDVIDVYSLNYAFTGATAFNQNLGLWKLNRIDVMEAMFKNSGMSPANYDATLLGWSKNPTLNKNKTLGAEGMKYCSPGGREILERDFNWKFTGDQPVFNNPLGLSYEFCLNGPSEPIIRPEKFPDYEFTWYSDSRGTQQISNSPEPNTTTAGDQQFYLRVGERSSGCSSVLTSINVSVNTFRCENNVPSKDLVSYYKLKGNGEDASPNDLDGQLTGPESAKDRFGNENSAYFFKTGQKITIPSASAYYIPEWTVAAWVNTENINGYAAAFSLWSSDPSSFYWIGTYNGKVNLYTGRSGSQIDLISSKSIADGLWHHIAGTFSNGVARLYVDGILEASGNVDFITPTAGIPQIGNDYKNEFFGGIIDDVAVYKRGFTSIEVSDLFQVSSISTGSNTSPTEIQLSSSGIIESQPVGTSIGNFNAIDSEGGSFSYSLVPGEGSTDNSSFTIDGSTLKTSQVFDFERKSSYTIRVRTTDSGGLTFEKIFTITINNSLELTDTEGNQYNTVIIGTQEWMTENLKVGKYRNGDQIALVTDATAWTNLSTGAFTYFNNDATYNTAYGKLYNWFAATDPRGVCPSGWRTPTDSDWNTLTSFLGGENVAGGKLKATGSSGGWNIPNNEATNESGFSGLPSGSRKALGEFDQIGLTGYFWTSTAIDANSAWTRVLAHNFGTIFRDPNDVKYGHPVRCLKETSINNTNPTGIQLSSSAISESQASGTEVGVFNTVDAEGGPFVYTFTPGEGSTDNSSFTIDGSTLKLATTLNAATKSVYTIRVRVTDSGGLFFEKSFTLNVLSAEPTSQPTSLSFSNIIPGAMTVSFTAPATAPSGYLVLRKKGGTITAIPQDGTGYDLNATLGDATVVYNGSVSSFNESSLEKGSTYYYVVFAYNGSGSTINYNTTNPLAGQQLVPLDILTPASQATDIKLKSLSPTSIQVVFTPPAQQPSGYLILRKKDSAPTSTPVDGTVYTKGSDLGDGAVVNAGSISTITDTGLTALTKYYYTIFSFNGSGNQIKYLVANPLSGNITTFASEPAGQPSSITFSNVTTTGLKVSYSAPTAVPTGYLVLRNSGATATAVVPEDGVTYSAGATLGTANVAYSGTALSFDDASLTSGTNYFYQVIAYNGTGATINYLTAAPLTGSQYTLFTEPSAQPASLTFTEVTTTSFTVNYSAAAGSTSGYIAIKKAGSAPTGNPEDGKVYKSGDAVGDGAVAYVGSNLSFAESGLTAGISYFYRIYSYSGQSTGTNYLQTAPLSGTGSTFAIEPTSAPTALSFTNVTTSSFTVSFTAPSTAPSGYLVIRKIGSAPTTAPVDGNTYNEGTALGDGLVTFVGNATTFNQTLLEKNLTYHYKIFVFNGSGSSTNYLQNSPLSGSQLVPLDITGPLFSANTTVQESAANTAVNVSLTITDPDTPVTSALISYGPSGSSAFTVIDAAMTSAGSNVWTFTIPANAVANPGVRYRVKANNEYGLSSVSEGYFIGISITGEGLPIPYTNPGTTIEAYTIISIPLKLPSNAVDAVFGPALGQYGDKNKWRMFHYQNGQTIELSGSSKLELGKGYWLISSQPATLSTGPGSTNGSADKPVTITLNNGWNQIGNPYTYRINWQDVLNDPANAGNTFQNTLRIFTSGAFTNGTGLNPFQGGFVFVNSGNKLTYPAADKGNRVAGEQEQVITNSVAEWILPLQLSNSKREISHSGIGMRKDASEGFDKYDDFTLPRMSEFVELNHNKILHRANYTRDVVPVSGQQEWSFEIASSENGEWHKLKWPVVDFVDPDHELVLWDQRAGRPVDMKRVGEYKFRAPASIQILFGDADFIKDRTRSIKFVLHEPIPNPTDGAVRISFVVPDNQSGDEVELQLLDQQGRQVGKPLKDRYDAGYHEAELNGLTDAAIAPDGLYLLRCTTGAVVEVRKVVLRR